MKKLLVTLLAVVLASSMVLGGAVAETKIGVSIMELTAYTWYLGVIRAARNGRRSIRTRSSPSSLKTAVRT